MGRDACGEGSPRGTFFPHNGMGSKRCKVWRLLGASVFSVREEAKSSAEKEGGKMKIQGERLGSEIVL